MDDSRNRKSTIALLVAVFWALTSLAFFAHPGRTYESTLRPNNYDTLECQSPVKDLGITEIFKEIYRITKNRGDGGNATGSAAGSLIARANDRFVAVAVATTDHTPVPIGKSKLWLLYRSLLI